MLYDSREETLSCRCVRLDRRAHNSQIASHAPHKYAQTVIPLIAISTTVYVGTFEMVPTPTGDAAEIDAPGAALRQ